MNIFTLPGLGSPAIYLKIPTKIQSRVCNVIDPDLASQFQSFSHHSNIASLYLFYKYFYGSFSNVLWPHEFKWCTRLAIRSLHFAVEMASFNHKFYSNNFFSSSSYPWNSLPVPCFFKSLNLISISIFCFFPEICSFIVLSPY